MYFFFLLVSTSENNGTVDIRWQSTLSRSIRLFCFIYLGRHEINGFFMLFWIWDFIFNALWGFLLEYCFAL